ncbi:glycosyltransferase family A protein [Gottfriedia acidiceleris]|uniref:glycosyltransferase family A protein n=1 Tax=Gottfriedia acidiceleris TaxID=371036 RepID=UPI002FFE8270
MDIILSILIPTVPERMGYLNRIINELDKQSKTYPVEILVLLENKKRSIGEKRNVLIEQAKGDYVVFIDDDDRIEPNYIELLCSAINETPNVDCIIFDVLVNFNNQYSKVCKYGKEFAHGEDDNYYYRKPNHLMCYSKKIASTHKFLNISFGEDDEWGRRVSNDIKIQKRIPSILYYYDYIPKDSSWYV